MKSSKHVASSGVIGLTLAGLACVLTLNVVAGSKRPATLKQDKPQAPASDCPEVEVLRKQQQRLKMEVDRLKRQVKELEKYKEIDHIRDLLMREEQRGEEIQLKLIDVVDRQSKLQARLVTVDQQLSPENIERALAGVGSLRPEETREGARRRLTQERQGLLSQIQLARQEQTRLQSSLISTDQSIQRLRQRLSEAISN